MIVCFAKIWRPPRTSRRLKTAKIWQVFQIGDTLLVDRFFTKQTKKALVQPGQKLFPMPPLFVTVVNDICTIETFKKLHNIVFSEFEVYS